MEIYIGNLSYQTTEREVEQLFLPYGSVDTVHIVTDHFTRQSKCFGYITMEKSQEGEQAIAWLQDAEFNDRKLVVKPARSCYDRLGNRW